MLRRLVIAICAFAVTLTTSQIACSAEVASGRRVMSEMAGIPPYVPRLNRTRPVVAVVAENTFTELADYVIPYGVLTESGAAQVFALATQAGPVQMFPALRVVPQASVNEFDTRFPDGADYVIVPAVHRTDDLALLAWVKAQANKGATIVGVCDGVWVLANAGLLAGRKAVGHWYSFDDLKSKFPKTEWLRNTRYVVDGNIITTTGVSASIPISLALVEAIAGRERAMAVARTMGANGWSATHRSDHYKLNARHVFTAASNWLSFWSHENIGIPIANGVDEVGLALVADAYSRTYRSSAFSQFPSADRVTTRRGLIVLPDKIQSANAVDRIVALPIDVPPISALDATLRAIEQSYGSATSAFVALQLEYQWKWH